MECGNNKLILTTGFRVACSSRVAETWKATIRSGRIVANPRLSPAATSGRAYTIVRPAAVHFRCTCTDNLMHTRR